MATDDEDMPEGLKRNLGAARVHAMDARRKIEALRGRPNPAPPNPVCVKCGAVVRDDGSCSCDFDEISAVVEQAVMRAQQKTNPEIHVHLEAPAPPASTSDPPVLRRFGGRRKILAAIVALGTLLEALRQAFIHVPNGTQPAPQETRHER